MHALAWPTFSSTAKVSLGEPDFIAANSILGRYQANANSAAILDDCFPSP